MPLLNLPTNQSTLKDKSKVLTCTGGEKGVQRTLSLIRPRIPTFHSSGAFQKEEGKAEWTNAKNGQRPKGAE